VTRRLGPPTRGHSVGDPMGRRAAPRRWHNTVWLREGSGGNTALEPLIEELVSFAEGHAPALAELRAAGCRADVTCSIFPGTRSAPARTESATCIFGCGMLLDAELLRRLAALDLDLDLCGRRSGSENQRIPLDRPTRRRRSATRAEALSGASEDFRKDSAAGVYRSTRCGYDRASPRDARDRLCHRLSLA
jgi:hypothetical protein